MKLKGKTPRSGLKHGKGKKVRSSPQDDMDTNSPSTSREGISDELGSLKKKKKKKKKKKSVDGNTNNSPPTLKRADLSPLRCVVSPVGIKTPKLSPITSHFHADKAGHGGNKKGKNLKKSTHSKFLKKKSKSKSGGINPVKGGKLLSKKISSKSKVGSKSKTTTVSASSKGKSSDDGEKENDDTNPAPRIVFFRSHAKQFQQGRELGPTLDSHRRLIRRSLARGASNAELPLVRLCELAFPPGNDKGNYVEAKDFRRAIVHTTFAYREKLGEEYQLKESIERRRTGLSMRRIKRSPLKNVHIQKPAKDDECMRPTRAMLNSKQMIEETLQESPSDLFYDILNNKKHVDLYAYLKHKEKETEVVESLAGQNVDRGSDLGNSNSIGNSPDTDVSAGNSPLNNGNRRVKSQSISHEILDNTIDLVDDTDGDDEDCSIIAVTDHGGKLCQPRNKSANVHLMDVDDVITLIGDTATGNNQKSEKFAESDSSSVRRSPRRRLPKQNVLNPDVLGTEPVSEDRTVVEGGKEKDSLDFSKHSNPGQTKGLFMITGVSMKRRRQSDTSPSEPVTANKQMDGKSFRKMLLSRRKRSMPNQTDAPVENGGVTGKAKKTLNDYFKVTGKCDVKEGESATTVKTDTTTRTSIKSPTKQLNCSGSICEEKEPPEKSSAAQSPSCIKGEVAEEDCTAKQTRIIREEKETASTPVKIRHTKSVYALSTQHHSPRNIVEQDGHILTRLMPSDSAGTSSVVQCNARMNPCTPTQKGTSTTSAQYSWPFANEKRKSASSGSHSVRQVYSPVKRQPTIYSCSVSPSRRRIPLSVKAEVHLVQENDRATYSESCSVRRNILRMEPKVTPGSRESLKRKCSGLEEAGSDTTSSDDGRTVSTTKQREFPWRDSQTGRFSKKFKRDLSTEFPVAKIGGSPINSKSDRSDKTTAGRQGLEVDNLTVTSNDVEYPAEVLGTSSCSAETVATQNGVPLITDQSERKSEVDKDTGQGMRKMRSARSITEAKSKERKGPVDHPETFCNREDVVELEEVPLNDVKSGSSAVRGTEGRSIKTRSSNRLADDTITEEAILERGQSIVPAQTSYCDQQESDVSSHAFQKIIKTVVEDTNEGKRRRSERLKAESPIKGPIKAESVDCSNGDVPIPGNVTRPKLQTVSTPGPQSKLDSADIGRMFYKRRSETTPRKQTLLRRPMSLSKLATPDHMKDLQRNGKRMCTSETKVVASPSKCGSRHSMPMS